MKAGPTGAWQGIVRELVDLFLNACMEATTKDAWQEVVDLFLNECMEATTKVAWQEIVRELVGLFLNARMEAATEDLMCLLSTSNFKLRI